MRRQIIVVGYLLLLAAGIIALKRALVTDSPTSFSKTAFDVSRGDRNFDYEFWNTRNKRVIVDVSPATARIDLYLLDEKGIDLLYANNTDVEPVLNFTGVDGCDFTYQPQYRGVFLILIENVGNRTAQISARFLGQGLEWDILQFSAVLAVVGAAMAITPRFVRGRAVQTRMREVK